ncbi:MAG: glycosyltransferase family 1 protein [Candidatus Binatia bacterium]
MRVGFDLTCLKAPMGGYERHARSLLAALAGLPKPPEMVAFIERTYGPRLVPTGMEARAVATLPRFILKVLLQDQTYWPMLMRRARLDVVHTPIFAGMVAAPRPYVLTLHDLIPLQTPEAISRSAAAYWRAVLPRAARRADAIITVSDFTRSEVLEHFGFPPERVVTIPNGVDAHFAPVADPAVLDRVRVRHRLPARFVLFVGIASPRKNLDRLVRAFGALTDSDRGDAELVFAGPPGWKNAELERAIAASPVAARIRHLGVVAEEDLPALYTLATAVANLSSREGFGLPALEALACGAPLVCANRTSFPEVVGDTALLVDPDDEAAVSAALAALLRGGAEIHQRRSRGLARARIYTWERAAVATDAVYRRVSS